MGTSDYQPFDVVLVPFPFIDRAQQKKRPAIILSGSELNHKIGHSVMAMITSAKNSPWPLDVEIHDLEAAGLPAKSVIRMKLFTLDNQLIVKRIGRLGLDDQKALSEMLTQQLFRAITHY